MTKIYHTDQYKLCLQHIYVHSEQYKKGKAAEIRRDVEKAEKRIAEKKEKGQSAGTLDPKFHSSIFRYVQILNTQKLFFCDFGDDVVMVFAGNATRAWDRVLEDEKDFIIEQISKLKAQKVD